LLGALRFGLVEAGRVVEIVSEESVFFGVQSELSQLVVVDATIDILESVVQNRLSLEPPGCMFIHTVREVDQEWFVCDVREDSNPKFDGFSFRSGDKSGEGRTYGLYASKIVGSIVKADIEEKFGTSEVLAVEDWAGFNSHLMICV
jgi:hypothetical protein